MLTIYTPTSSDLCLSQPKGYLTVYCLLVGIESDSQVLREAALEFAMLYDTNLKRNII